MISFLFFWQLKKEPRPSKLDELAFGAESTKGCHSVLGLNPCLQHLEKCQPGPWWKLNYLPSFSLSLSLSLVSLSLSRTHTNTHTHRLNMFLSSVTLVRVCSDRDKCTHSHSSQPAPTGWTLLLVKLEDHVCGYSSIHSSICPHSPPLQGWVLTLSELQHLAPPSPCLRLRHDFTPFFSWVGLFQIPHISDPT